jgi:hypothetical protein
MGGGGLIDGAHFTDEPGDFGNAGRLGVAGCADLIDEGLHLGNVFGDLLDGVGGAR